MEYEIDNLREYNIDALIWVVQGKQRDIIDKLYVDLNYDFFKPCVRDTADFAVRVQGKCFEQDGLIRMGCKLDTIQNEDITYAVLVGGNEQ